MGEALYVDCLSFLCKGHDSVCLMSAVCAKQIPADPMAQGQGVCRGEAWGGGDGAPLEHLDPPLQPLLVHHNW